MDSVVALRPFVPAQDFERSILFYQALGFTITHRGDGVAGVKIGSFSFILQQYYVKELAENLMIQLMVRDVDAWWRRVETADLVAQFTVKPPRAPVLQSWGLKVGFLFDPSGVLWHIAETPFWIGALAIDRVLRRADLGKGRTLVDIGFAAGRIAAISPDLVCDAPEVDLGGRLVLPGFVDTHVHLDKSCLDTRCPCGASLRDAVSRVAAAKLGFTEQDVYDRARQTLEMSITQGTNRMRTHVEVDPRVGLTSLRALHRLKRDYAWAIDLQICVFPQDGLLDDPGCDGVLVEALDLGADLIGGAPYMDRDPQGQIDRIFDPAVERDLDVDLHLDFSLDASSLDLDEVCRQADRRRWGGRTTIGHATKLSALPAAGFEAAARRLAAAGVAVTVLPATDLYLMGREADYDVPRGVAPAHRLARAGVTCSIATNNLRNPFTPYGDASLVRMANLFANVAQLGTRDDLDLCLDLVTGSAARVMRLAGYGIAVGAPATMIAFDAASPAEIVAGIIAPEIGFKDGRQTFARPPPFLLPSA